MLLLLKASSYHLIAKYPVDVREEDDTILVDAKLPLFHKDHVQLTLDRGVLRILAERKETEKAKKEKAKGQTRVNERRYTRIERCFTLPVSVDESKVDAKLQDGVLHLSLCKTKEAQPCRITVK